MQIRERVEWLMRLSMSVHCSNLKAMWWDHAGIPLAQRKQNTAILHCSACYQHRAGTQLLKASP